MKSSIGDAVRGAEKGWEVAVGRFRTSSESYCLRDQIRNLVDLPERYKATYDDFLQAKVRVEELTKELAEGHKQQNRLEERIKRYRHIWYSHRGSIGVGSDCNRGSCQRVMRRRRLLHDNYDTRYDS